MLGFVVIFIIIIIIPSLEEEKDICLHLKARLLRRPWPAEFHAMES